MKVGKLAIAAVAASALVLAGCSSSDSDSAAESTDDAAASEDSGDSGGSGPKICMVTHGDGGGFWSVAKAGADKAGADLPVQFTYQETTNDAQLQAQLIESFISEGCEGIAVSAPNPDAISDALAKADEAGISIVTMNSGSKVFKDLASPLVHLLVEVRSRLESKAERRVRLAERGRDHNRREHASIAAVVAACGLCCCRRRRCGVRSARLRRLGLS